MTSSTAVKPNWTAFFKSVRKQISGDLLPYVTRLSQRYEGKKELPFLILISTIISLRTKDITTEECSERFFKKAKTPKAVLKHDLKTWEEVLYPCGFYKTKAKQILELSQILVEDYQSKVPDTIEELIRFKGVGRKTANLVLIEGYNKNAICVDTHVHRILNRLGFIKTKMADDTEMVLREILPKRYWKTINYDLVMLGQYHCKPRNPDCKNCTLNQTCSWSIHNS